MKIELKKFYFSSQMSEETNAFKADVYINGVKAAYADNDGRGGCTNYRPYEGMRDLVKKAEDYCKNLPPHVSDSIKGEDGKPFSYPMNLEHFIDDLVDEQIRMKEQKKFEKKFTNCIIWGVPGANSYREVKFRVPLSQIPTAQLQQYVDKYKAQFEKGEQFLNNNLKQLNINI